MQEKSLTSNTSKMQTFVLLSSTTISFAISLFVFFSLAHRNGVAIAQLAGSEVTCNVENESIPVPDILNTKCINCTCKNGMVECNEPECPEIEGCYVLQELQNDECCKRCQGCLKDGVYHDSGTQWIDPDQPCRSFSCLAGVITESSIHCYTLCAKPVPPAPGQCCPTCPNCQLKDKIITHETSIVPKEDPCVLCECISDKLMCRKKACPVLNCPESKIVLGSDKCCPRCLGAGTYMTPPRGACLLGTKLHNSGTEFTLDACTRCRCENATILCQRENCPISNCKQEDKKILPGQCCLRCTNMHAANNVSIPIVDESLVLDTNESQFDDQGDNDYQSYENHKLEDKKSCSYDGVAYKDDETWNTKTCETCNCREGKIKCSALSCTAVRCPPNSVLKIPEGECCPVCEETKGVCTVFGGSHFRTFDGKLYAFIGSCKYQLSSDCDSGTFNIRLKNTVVGNDVTIKRVSLKMEKFKVDLQQNKNIKVNDQIIDLPYRQKDKLEVKEVNGNIVVTSKIGIKLIWNYLGFLEVSIPTNYRKRVCGLCGDFNFAADNDFVTREGILVEDPAIFAQSWSSGDEICLETRQYGMRGCNPRKDQRLCSYIKGSIFGKCLKKINVTSYYETCLKDMCECPPDDLQCHCESFSDYVHDCLRLGILLPRWRKSVGC